MTANYSTAHVIKNRVKTIILSDRYISFLHHLIDICSLFHEVKIFQVQNFRDILYMIFHV